MIPVKSQIVDIDNMPGEEIEFGIGDPRWVMKTQADLYSDITTAIIREYSTNAYDAHVMAGNSDPIEVTLPSLMNPYFIVEDKGTGMDMETFRKIYTQFGVSNKRDSNDTNGMLGYGSKSGVAYTTQFTVTSVQNGTKLVGVIRRKPDWSIVLKVVSQSRTTEPNGTRIEIPVHNTEEFIKKANDFYKFWLPGRVLVNGREPIHDVGEKVAEGLYYSSHWSASYVVMGNVAYRINNPAALFNNTALSPMNFVAYADTITNGDEAQAAVEFTPSREDLKYTEHTKNTLHTIIKRFADGVLDTAKNELAAAANHAEAFEIGLKWSKVLGQQYLKSLTFKGDAFESSFKISAQRYHRASYSTTVIRVAEWYLEWLPKTMVVTEFDINMSSSVKSRATEYAQMKGWPETYILFTAQSAKDIDSPWVNKEHFVNWADLKEALPKKAKTSNTLNIGGRVSGSWDYFDLDGFHEERSLPNDGSRVMYVDVHFKKFFSTYDILSELGEKDIKVLVVPANRLPKLLRENPEVKPFLPYAKSKVETDEANLIPEDAKKVLAIAHNTRTWVDALDVSRIDDPEFANIKSLVGGFDQTTYQPALAKNRRLGKVVRHHYYINGYQPETTDYVGDNYPLLTDRRPESASDDVYLYINAKYNEKIKENKND